ncbi:hypothetical protein [Natronoglycomyces albus]|uniref:Uncharacterized protein n=1 Tax=Natronoglycomyces albus TaxID=2811108 RepID=A0A895XMY0_9ACTN|nr:hypothetical protein [Natronoglycomyces albus]QSB05132.1 hypothetical protein JQS30_15445 [Natronoglycomyces albus]
MFAPPPDPDDVNNQSRIAAEQTVAVPRSFHAVEPPMAIQVARWMVWSLALLGFTAACLVLYGVFEVMAHRGLTFEVAFTLGLGCGLAGLMVFIGFVAYKLTSGAMWPWIVLLTLMGMDVLRSLADLLISGSPIAMVTLAIAATVIVLLAWPSSARWFVHQDRHATVAHSSTSGLGEGEEVWARPTSFSLCETMSGAPTGFLDT